MTLSPELRVPVPTVGGIHLIIFKQVGIKKITSIVTVMEHNSSWLISTLDKSSTPVATILCVECWSWCTTAVHIPHKSLLDYHHTALLQWQCPRPSSTEILCCTKWLWCLGGTNYRHSIWRCAEIPPGGDTAGRRNVSINANFNTKKILMYKYSSSFSFAVSEVAFFNCFASTSTSKYLYAVCCILPFLYDIRLLNMYSSWDHYHDNYGRYSFHRRICQQWVHSTKYYTYTLCMTAIRIWSSKTTSHNNSIY